MENPSQNAGQTDAVPAVSVVMTVFRPDPLFFPQAVASIVAQTLGDWELIIIERASDASAQAMLAGMDDPRVALHAMGHDSALVEQKNRGLALARGAFIAMMDADDIAAPTRLERQREYLVAHPDVSVVGSHVAIIDAQGRRIGQRHFPETHDGIIAALPGMNVISYPTVMLRNAPGLRFDAAYSGADDYELWSRMAKAGAQFATYPQELLHYRIHPQQMKRTHLHQTMRSTLMVKTRYWQHDATIPMRLRQVVERGLLCLPQRLLYWLCVRLRYR